MGILVANMGAASSLAGVAVYALGIALMLGTSKSLYKRRTLVQKFSDKRVSLVQEL